MLSKNKSLCYNHRGQQNYYVLQTRTEGLMPTWRANLRTKEYYTSYVYSKCRIWTLESQYLTKSFKFLSYRLWFALASHFIASYYDTKKYNSEKHNGQKRRINECRKQKTIWWSYLKRKMYSSRSLTIFRRFKTPKVLRDEALSLSMMTKHMLTTP